MGTQIQNHQEPVEVAARLATIGAMFDSVTKRRREIASEIEETGGISTLSRESLLDMLSILAFDRNATQRSILKGFYGGEDDRARAMEKTVIETLHRDHGCDNRDIHGAVGRGCSLMNGYLSGEDVWQGGAGSASFDFE